MLKEKKKNDVVYINIFQAKIAFSFLLLTELIHQFDCCRLVVTLYK